MPDTFRHVALSAGAVVARVLRARTAKEQAPMLRQQFETVLGDVIATEPHLSSGQWAPGERT